MGESLPPDLSRPKMRVSPYPIRGSSLLNALLPLLFATVAFSLRNWYNFIRYAEVAQQVEQRTENPRVIGPIPILGTSPSGSSSVVECLLAKEEVASSNLVFRSNFSSRSGGIGRRDGLKNHWGATLMSVRSRPSAVNRRLPSCVVVAQRTLNPFAQVRTLDRQPVF